MKLFTFDKDGKFVPFKEQIFKEENKEIDLEYLLEKNPEYFFDNTKIIIIGRQVTSNLNSFVDLMGVDELGNTVIIELKRHKTPRETLAQLIEYASFIDNLDYGQLNAIFQNYSGEEVELETYHQQYFENKGYQNISWNKSSKLVIVAQDITPEIKQTSLYLRKKGLDVYCIEFKYFVNKSNIRIISSDFVVGDDEFLRQKVKSDTQLPKINKNKFIDTLDNNGRFVFDKLFEFAEIENLMFKWGSKGFSLNLPLENGFVALFYGYPPKSVFKQSIYTGFEEIRRKINNPDKLINNFKTEINRLNYFGSAQTNLKWIISKKYSDNEVEQFIVILKTMMEQIKNEGLKE